MDETPIRSFRLDESECFTVRVVKSWNSSSREVADEQPDPAEGAPAPCRWIGPDDL